MKQVNDIGNPQINNIISIILLEIQIDRESGRSILIIRPDRADGAGGIAVSAEYCSHRSLIKTAKPLERNRRPLPDPDMFMSDLYCDTGVVRTKSWSDFRPGLILLAFLAAKVIAEHYGTPVTLGRPFQSMHG